jgi:hypothetical protein
MPRVDDDNQATNENPRPIVFTVWHILSMNEDIPKKDKSLRPGKLSSSKYSHILKARRFVSV